MIAQDRKAIADRYKQKPSFLLGGDQLEELVPGLLTSYLAVELVRLGWAPSYSDEDGLTITRDGEVISPGNLIDDLISAKIDSNVFSRLSI